MVLVKKREDLSGHKKVIRVPILGLLGAWALLLVVPSELQHVTLFDSPLKVWGNIISLVVFALFLAGSCVIFFSSQGIREPFWRVAILRNPWLWTSVLGAYLAAHYVYQPNTLGLNFVINLMTISIALPYIIHVAELFGRQLITTVVGFGALALAANWVYQITNGISYSSNPDTTFALALPFLLPCFLLLLNRTSSFWQVAAVQGIFFISFLFLVASQIRLPALVAGILFALQGLWLVSSWVTRLGVVLGNAIVAIGTWFWVAQRPILIQGELYASGRESIYRAAFSEGLTIFGSGTGSARVSVLSTLGHSNPVSTGLTMLVDFGVVGCVIVLALILSIFWQIRPAQIEEKPNYRVFFVAVAVVLAFGALSVFWITVESTLIFSSALVAYLCIVVESKLVQKGASSKEIGRRQE